MPEFTSRPPRIQPELPFGEITIPSPPTSDTAGGQQLVQVALPLVTIIGYVFVSAMGQGRSMLLLIPMGLSVVASSAVALITFFRTGRIEQQKRRAYAQTLIECARRLTASHEMQRRFYLYNYPETDTVLDIASDRDYQRSGLRLWERRTTDPRFRRAPAWASEPGPRRSATWSAAGPRDNRRADERCAQAGGRLDVCQRRAGDYSRAPMG